MPAASGSSRKRGKVLLVNPNRMKPPVAPLALDYLAHALKQSQFQVDLLDLCFSADIPGDIDSYFARNDVLAVAVTIRNTDDTYLASQDFCIDRYKEVLDLLKAQTDVPIILGGLYATLAPEHARLYSGADVIVRGAGENAVLPLLREILGDKHVRPREFSGLEEMPFPAFDLLRNKDSLPLLTSRGCPFRCSFCATPLLYRNFEQRSSLSVISEIERSMRQWGTRHLSFYDDALLIGKASHLLPLLELAVGKKWSLAFHTRGGHAAGKV